MTQYRQFTAGCHAPTCLRILALVLIAAPLAHTSFADHLERPFDAMEVFHCVFDTEWDNNFDDWPDRWIRRSGPGYPHYVNIRIRDNDQPQSTTGRSLEIDLDGASASISSPPIRATARFSYQLVARLRIRALQHSDVAVSIDFFDIAGKLLQTEKQPLQSHADGWHTVTLNSIDPLNKSIDRAVIRLDVERVGRGDLHGKVWLDEVWLGRLPRITVTSNSPHNVYQTEADVVVRCELSGIREQTPEVRFQLLDAAGKQLQDASLHLDGQLIEEESTTASGIVDGIGTAPKGYAGSIEWRPSILQEGFYRVVVTMLSSDSSNLQTDTMRTLDRRVIWLAVVSPLTMPPNGDFGWTLPATDHPLSFEQLASLLPQVGINWVKVPAWYDAADSQRGDEIIRFVELLGTSNIEVVGVIDQPPADTDIARRLGAQASIADLLSIDQAHWLPVLDPAMARLSMRLRYWQLGGDRDASLVGFPHLVKRISELRARLFRFGQQVKLGLVWAWDGEHPPPSDASWDFEQLTPDPSLSIDQFERFVSRPRTGTMRRWITIEPPPSALNSAQAESSDLTSRANEFVRKLIAAKQYGADAIFISQPFHNERGLMREDGTPAELLLPWRTTAAMLSGASYIGAVQLPGGSENRNYLRPDGQVVMVVWNNQPTRETLFLGNHVKQLDIWGGEKKLVSIDHEQSIEVGPTPTFILGLSEPIVRWRMAVSFENNRVESIFAKSHPNELHFQNFFSQGVGGTVSIVAELPADALAASTELQPDSHVHKPDRWTIELPGSTFALGANDSARLPFEVRLKNATFGEQPIRIEFMVDSDEKYRFSVYRTMWVGAGDVTIDFKSHIDQDGTLVVEQYMTNTSERPVDFKCYLYAKGHRRQRAQVYRLEATAHRTVYRYPRGTELIGKELMFEAEEIGGERVLKYRFLASDQPPTMEPAPTHENAAPSERQTNPPASPNRWSST